MKNVLIASLMVLITGCTGATDAMSQWSGLGKITEEKSSFDGATVIDMSPNFLYEKGAWMANKVRLGAHWDSKRKNEVALVLSYESNTSGAFSSTFADIRGLDINIEGDIVSFDTIGGTSLQGSEYDQFQRTIHTKSQNAVVIPYAILDRMMQSQDCRLRVRTSNGYEDSHFSIDRVGSGGAATAKYTLREFMNRVDKVQSL